MKMTGFSLFSLVCVCVIAASAWKFSGNKSAKQETTKEGSDMGVLIWSSDEGKFVPEEKHRKAEEEKRLKEEALYVPDYVKFSRYRCVTILTWPSDPLFQLIEPIPGADDRDIDAEPISNSDFNNSNCPNKTGDEPPKQETKKKNDPGKEFQSPFQHRTIIF